MYTYKLKDLLADLKDFDSEAEIISRNDDDPKPVLFHIINPVEVDDETHWVIYSDGKGGTIYSEEDIENKYYD